MGLQIYEDGFKPANLNGHTCRSSRYLSSVVSVLSLCKNFVKVVDLFLVAQLQIANLKVNILIGMHTYKEESHHSDFWSTYNHKTKGIKGNPKNNIQLLAHDTDGGKEQRKLRGTKTGGSSKWEFLPPKEDTLMPSEQLGDEYNDINRLTFSEPLVRKLPSALPC